MTSLVQCAAPTNGASATTLIVTLTTSVFVGEELFMFTISDGSGTGHAASDSKGNAWTLDNQSSTATTSMRTHLFKSHVVTPLISGVDTITLTTSVASLKALCAFKVSGKPILNGGYDAHTQSGNQTTATPVTGSSGTLTQANELAIACYAWVATATFAEPANYTNVNGTGVKLATQTTVREGGIAYLETNANTALNPSATLGSSLNCCGMITTYRITKQDLNNYRFFKVGDGMSISETIK